MIMEQSSRMDRFVANQSGAEPVQLFFVLCLILI